MKKILLTSALFIFSSNIPAVADIIRMDFSGTWDIDGVTGTTPSTYFLPKNAFNGWIVYNTDTPNQSTDPLLVNLGRYWIEEFRLSTPDSSGTNQLVARDDYAAVSNSRFEVGNNFVNHNTEVDFFRVLWTPPWLNTYTGQMQNGLGHLEMPQSLENMYTKVEFMLQDTTALAFETVALPEFVGMTSIGKTMFNESTIKFDFGSSSHAYGTVSSVTLSRQPTPTPEPTTMALFLIGLAGIGIVQKKNKFQALS